MNENINSGEEFELQELGVEVETIKTGQEFELITNY